MSSIIHNDPDSVKLRRNKSNLVALGTGIMAFGIWSIIKTLMEFVLGSALEDISKEMADISGVGRIFVIVFAASIVLIDLLVRFHVGINAIRAGRDKKSHRYMGSVILLMAVSLASLIYMIIQAFGPTGISMNDEASIFVELTSLIILIEMVAVTVSTSKIKARAAKTEDQYAG